MDRTGTGLRPPSRSPSPPPKRQKLSHAPASPRTGRREDSPPDRDPDEIAPPPSYGGARTGHSHALHWEWLREHALESALPAVTDGDAGAPRAVEAPSASSPSVEARQGAETLRKRSACRKSLGDLLGPAAELPSDAEIDAFVSTSFRWTAPEGCRGRPDEVEALLDFFSTCAAVRRLAYADRLALLKAVCSDAFARAPAAEQCAVLVCNRKFLTPFSAAYLAQENLPEQAKDFLRDMAAQVLDNPWRALRDFGALGSVSAGLRAVLDQAPRGANPGKVARLWRELDRPLAPANGPELKVMMFQGEFRAAVLRADERNSGRIPVYESWFEALQAKLNKGARLDELCEDPDRRAMIADAALAVLCDMPQPIPSHPPLVAKIVKSQLASLRAVALAAGWPALTELLGRLWLQSGVAFDQKLIDALHRDIGCEGMKDGDVLLLLLEPQINRFDDVLLHPLRAAELLEEPDRSLIEIDLCQRAMWAAIRDPDLIFGRTAPTPGAFRRLMRFIEAARERQMLASMADETRLWTTVCRRLPGLRLGVGNEIEAAEAATIALQLLETADAPLTTAAIEEALRGAVVELLESLAAFLGDAPLSDLGLAMPPVNAEEDA